MSTIQQELEDLTKMHEKKRSETAETEDLVRAQLEAIRAKIKAGESTGDRIRDYALIHQRDDVSGWVSKIFRGMESELSGKTGQLFVLVEYDRHAHDPFERDGGCMGYPMRADPFPETLGIGFLSGDTLSLDMASGKWAIPCHAFVRCDLRTQPILQPGPATFYETVLAPMAYLLSRCDRPLDGTLPRIITGDDDVLSFFKKELHRYTADISHVRTDIVRKTLPLAIPDGHWIATERGELCKRSFAEALELERKVHDYRFELERIRTPILSNQETDKILKEIRSSMTLLAEKLELAVSLGIDPMRSEVVRLREQFGRYWK